MYKRQKCHDCCFPARLVSPLWLLLQQLPGSVVADTPAGSDSVRQAPREIRGCHWRGQNRKRTFCQLTLRGGIRLPGAVSAAGASFFEKPSSCPPVTRLSRTLFHALPVFLRDAASLSGPPRSMPGVFFPAKYSHRADEICFSATVFTVFHQEDEEAALPLR